MKKQIKAKKAFLYRTLRCVFGVSVSAAVMISSMPVDVFADQDMPRVPAGILQMLSTDENVISEYTINTAQDLIDLSNLPPENYQNAVITITSTNSSLGSTDIPDFNGLGSDDYPFRGKIVSSLSTTMHLKIDNALFRCISDKAELPGIIAFTRITDGKNTPVLAQKVVHESGADEIKDWSVIINKGLDNTNSETNYSFGGIIGEIGQDCNINLSVTNNTSAKINGDTHAGMACCVLGENAQLEIKYTEPGKTEYKYDVIADNGCAGGLIGYMKNGSEAVLNCDYSYSGKVNAYAELSDLSDPNGCAGGFTGYSDNGIFVNGEHTITLGAKVNGSEKSGGFAGCMIYSGDNQESTHIFNLSHVNMCAEISGIHETGGLFGTFENRSTDGADIIISDGSVSVYVKQNQSDKRAVKTDFGGLIGKYISSSLSSGLYVNNINITSSCSSGTVENFGGLIGTVDSANQSGSYIGILNSVVKSEADSGISVFGGLVANATDCGHFMNIGNVSLAGTVKSGSLYGGIVGKYQSGVLRLSGTTDLSLSIPETGNGSGQIVGSRGQTLIYALGNGNSNGWTFKRSATQTRTDDIGNWGSVLRSDKIEGIYGVLTFDSAAHTVTVKSAQTDIKNLAQFGRTVLNIQLNSGNKGALRFDSSSATSNEILSGNITLGTDIDLRGTGLTGITRDNGSNAKFSGTFNGNGHTVTLSIGESYGLRNDTAASGDGSGKIYMHTHNGLFAKISDGVINKITVNGKIDAGADSAIKIGGIAAEVSGGTTVINSSVSAQTITLDGNSTCYAGGKIGEITGGTVTVSGCTEKATVTYNGTGNDAFIGGVIGHISNADNITVNFNKLTVGCSLNVSKAVTDSKTGGLISGISGGSDKTVNISDVKIDGMKTQTNASETSGGLLGYGWFNTNVYFKPSGSTGGLAIDQSSDEALTELSVNGAAAFGGLVCSATGYWQVNDISFNKVRITGNSGCRYGMLVCYGNSNNGSSLYLEVTDKDAYVINKDNVSLGLDGASIFDELVAYSTNDSGSGSNGQGVVSLPAVYNGTRTVIMDGVHCNTYQNQTVKSDGSGWGKNTNTRYYYNLDFIRVKDVSSLTDGENILLWSVSKYGCGNISRYFPSKIDNSISGNFDLNGLSYYPVDIKGNVNIGNASFKFYNKEINASEAQSSGGSDKVIRDTGNGHTQHYLMHYGVFRDIKTTSSSDICSLTINGKLKLAGSIGMSSSHSGALVCGTVMGKNIDLNSYLASLTCSDTAQIELNDLYVSGGGNIYSPLLINKIYSYTNTLLRGIYTAASADTYDMNNQSYAASSLIGTVGSDNDDMSKGITIAFRNIAVDGRGSLADEPLSSFYNTSHSIFSKSTLLYSFQYVDGSGSSGSYDFTLDEDWNGTDPVHKVTYGKEISDSVENEGKQNKYLLSDVFISPLTNNAGQEYDFSKFIPYVYNNNGSTSLKNGHELSINLSHTDITEGCGTYGDPYIISNSEQLVQIAKAINGSFPADIKISYNSDTTQLCSHDDRSSYHTEYAYKDGKFEGTGVTDVSVSDMRNYLCEAYYKIQGTITLNSEFPGIGIETLGNTFRGVIIGSNANIIMEGNVPFIKISNGSVIKDLNIVYKNAVTVSQSSNAKFAPSKNVNAGSGCNYFGGVIGQIMGGDNIIDNVNVIYNSSVDVSGSNDKIIPVGGYVGVIRGGGLVFRNMSESQGMTSDSCEKTASEKYMYVNPIIGRVLDGYAVYSGTYSADHSTLDNGKKNYVIADISSPENIAEDQKLSVYADDSIYVAHANRTAVGWSKINVPNAQMLLVLSMLVSSGASSIEFKDKVSDQSSFDYTKWNKLKMHYTENSPYATGRTHIADYDCVGNVDTAANKDFVTSQYDFSCDRHDTAFDCVPYLIWYYTQKEDDDFSVVSSSPRKINVKWPAKLIAGSYCRYSIELTTPDIVYDMPEAFRGINALYGSSFSSNQDRLNIYMFGLNGSNGTINMRNRIREYNDDNYKIFGLGLFSRFIQNDNSCMVTKIKNNNDDYEDGIFDVDKFAVQNLTLSGSVDYSVIDSSGTLCNSGTTNVGGFAGTIYGSATAGNHYYFSKVCLKDLTVSGLDNTGGLIGDSSSSSIAKKIFISDISSDNLSVNGISNVGGLFGNLTGCERNVVIKGNSESMADFKITKITARGTSGNCGGLIGNSMVQIDIKDISVVSPHTNKCEITGANNAAGLLGTTSGKTNITECQVCDCNISSGVPSSNNNNAGGFIGYSENAVSLADSSVKNCTVKSVGTGQRQTGSFIGFLKNSVNGYNLLSKNNIIESGLSAGNWIGKITGTAKLTGICKKDGSALSSDIGNGSNTNGYLIYADYNCTCDEDNSNTVNASAPYVVVNPVKNYNVSGKELTGDGVQFTLNSDNTISATARQIIDDASSDSQPDGSYKQIKSQAQKFRSGGEYSANLTDYYSAEKDSTEKAGMNFPVLVIDNNDYSEITSMVNDYIAVLTNTPNMHYDKMEVSTYQWNGAGFADTGQPSLIYKGNSRTLHMANGRYDNEKKRFTLIDVQYTDPSGSGNIVYHLYIPVLVKKLLEFEFRADVLSGTDYLASDYENLDKQVVENHGTPVTSMITFTYKRTFGEWQDAINSGDNLLWNFNKYVLLRWDIGQGQSSRLPVGTKLTLVDKNKNSRVYYHTVAQGDFNASDDSNQRGKLYLSSFDGYDPVCLNELLIESTGMNVNAVSDSEGGLVLNGENGTQSAGATALAYLDGNRVYLRPFDDTTDVASVTKYKVNVGTQSDSQSIVNIDEKYYLTIQTDSSQSCVLKNMIEYPENVPLENPDIAGAGLPTYNVSPKRSDSDSGMTYVFGNFFTQDNMSVITKNQAQIDTGNKCIKAEMSVDIRINPDKNISQAYNSYSSNLEVYHAFIISYLEYNSDSSSTKTRNISKYASVNSEFTVSDLSGSSLYEQKSVINSPDVTKDVYPLKYPGSINTILKQHGNSGIMIKADVLIDYKECTDEVIKGQFPLRNSDADTDSDNSGIVLRAKSNLTYTDSETKLINSSITTGNAVEDSRKTHYHVKDVLKATLKYNAGNINQGDSKGSISQLGINANELTSNQTVPVVASGLYNASQLKNADLAAKIRFTLTISKKDDTGSYVRVDIDDFLKNAQFINGTSNTENASELIESADGNYYMSESDWKSGKTDNQTYNIITKFEVISKKIFQQNNFIYSNYWVNLNAELIDKNGNSIVGSDSSDHIIYTYARMFTDIIN